MKKKRKTKRKPPKFIINQQIQCLWLKGSIYYNGIITNVATTKSGYHRYEILYDDDHEIEKNVLEKHIRLVENKEGGEENKEMGETEETEENASVKRKMKV